MLHSYVTDMAARVTPTIQIPLSGQGQFTLSAYINIDLVQDLAVYPTHILTYLLKMIGI